MQVTDVYSLQNFLRSNKVFERFGINRIGIFGSFARGEKYNDIDLLLEEKIPFEKRMELQEFLEKSLHTKIDLVLKQIAEPIILFRAMKDIKYATRD